MLPVTIAAAMVIALASGITGAAIGVALRPSAPAASSGSNTNSPSGGGGTATLPSGGGSPSGGGLSSDQVAAAVDPTIVDVVNTLVDGEGTAEGTGIILNSSGDILTNNHVIESETSLSVQIGGQGQSYTATLLGYDYSDDVAVIKIQNPPSNLKVAPLGDSSTVNIGDQVVALGNAYGRGGAPAVATGSVTGLDQSITASDGNISENLSGMIEIDADIVPGDSGGPLVNSAGKIIGMDTAGSTNARGPSAAATQGYAIPINTARQIANQIISGNGSGSIVIGNNGPLIGVSVNDAPSGNGAQVIQVVPSSPAANAGIHAGDIITSVNGTQISSASDLSTALFGLRPGNTIQLGWMDSSGGQHTSSITLASGPPK